MKKENSVTSSFRLPRESSAASTDNLPEQNIRSNVPHKQDASGPALALWKLLLFLMSYRQGMRVSEVMLISSGPYGETGYYVCPRCSITMEREFMAFCDRCGQKLNWKDYKKAKMIHPGKPNT